VGCRRHGGVRRHERIVAHDFFDNCLERKAPEIAPSTEAFYRNAAAKFVKFMGDLADADVTEVTREQITRFRNEEGFPRDNGHARACARRRINGSQCTAQL